MNPTRLKGPAIARLRIDCFLRDEGRCGECDCRVYLDRGFFDRMHMAHIKSRGAGGPDTLDNVRTLCMKCHMLEHNGGKPCPPKPLIEPPCDFGLPLEALLGEVE